MNTETISKILDDAIVIGNGFVYYANPSGLVDREPLLNRKELVVDGIHYDKLSDGIKNKQILTAIFDTGRDSMRFYEKNMEHCLMLCAKYRGKSAAEMVEKYISWLNAIEQRKERLAKAREISNSEEFKEEMRKKRAASKKRRTPKPVKPLATEVKQPSEPTESEPETDSKRMARMKALSEKVKNTYGGIVLVFDGIHRLYKGGFDVLFTLDRTRIPTHAGRCAWVRANAKNLAKFAFEAIRQEPTWSKKLDPKARYFPQNVNTSVYGDVFIEFLEKPNTKNNVK